MDYTAYMASDAVVDEVFVDDLKAGRAKRSSGPMVTPGMLVSGLTKKGKARKIRLAPNKTIRMDVSRGELPDGFRRTRTLRSVGAYV